MPDMLGVSHLKGLQQRVPLERPDACSINSPSGEKERERRVEGGTKKESGRQFA